MDKWIIIHPTHLLPNPFMTQPAHLPPLVIITLFFTIFKPKDPKISLYPEGIKDIDFSALTPNVIWLCRCN